MQPPAAAYDERVVHPAQVERGQVECPARRGIGVVEHLEAPVELEPVDPVGAHPAADLVGGLEHEHVQTGAVQPARAAQPGQARADDDHVMTSSSHGEMLPPVW